MTEVFPAIRRYTLLFILGTFMDTTEHYFNLLVHQHLPIPELFQTTYSPTPTGIQSRLASLTHTLDKRSNVSNSCKTFKLNASRGCLLRVTLRKNLRRCSRKWWQKFPSCRNHRKWHCSADWTSFEILPCTLSTARFSTANARGVKVTVFDGSAITEVLVKARVIKEIRENFIFGTLWGSEEHLYCSLLSFVGWLLYLKSKTYYHDVKWCGTAGMTTWPLGSLNSTKQKPTIFGITHTKSIVSSASGRTDRFSWVSRFFFGKISRAWVGLGGWGKPQFIINQGISFTVLEISKADLEADRSQGGTGIRMPDLYLVPSLPC
jgi:hypothetical protein